MPAGHTFAPTSNIKYFLFFQVVSHPVPQHVITSMVSDGIPKWRTSGLFQRVIYISALALLFPFTATVSVIAPYSKIGKMARTPLIKFINGAASFVTMLGKLHYVKLWSGKTCHNMGICKYGNTWEYARICQNMFPYNDRIKNFVLIRENNGQRKPVFWPRMLHCVKNVRIPIFSPYSVRMRENTDQKNSKYG